MNQLKAIIVDDEATNREVLKRLIAKFCPEVEVVGSAQNVMEAVFLIRDHRPDVVFLDIEMPGEDGFSLFTHFEKPDFRVVFTTAHADYAIKAIKFAALDYLLKPVDFNELKQAVAKVRDSIQRGDGNNLLEKQINVLKESRTADNFDFKRIALPSADGVEFYNVSKILRCEAARAYSTFHFDDETKVLVSKPLSEFEKLLSECNFIRIHKSNMVNMTHVVKFVKSDGGYVVLSDGSHISVASRRKNEVMQILGT
ncbi:MAG: response regulator transcription factor [Flavobacteriales bacterium]